MLAWNYYDAGASYDIGIAADLLRRAMDRLISSTPATRYTKAGKRHHHYPVEHNPMNPKLEAIIQELVDRELELTKSLLGCGSEERRLFEYFHENKPQLREACTVEMRALVQRIIDASKEGELDHG